MILKGPEENATPGLEVFTGSPEVTSGKTPTILEPRKGTSASVEQPRRGRVKGKDAVGAKVPSGQKRERRSVQRFGRQFFDAQLNL